MTYYIHWSCWTNQLAYHVLQCRAVTATSPSLLDKIQSFALCQSNIATEHGHVTKRYIIYAHPLSWLNFHGELWKCHSCWIIWLPMGNPTTGNPTTNGNSNNQTWLGNPWEIDQFDQEIHPENLRSQRSERFWSRLPCLQIDLLRPRSRSDFAPSCIVRTKQIQTVNSCKIQ